MIVIRTVDDSEAVWKTMQILIKWHRQNSADLDLRFSKENEPGFSRLGVKNIHGRALKLANPVIVRIGSPVINIISPKLKALPHIIIYKIITKKLKENFENTIIGSPVTYCTFKDR